jgi:hypothetical protein
MSEFRWKHGVYKNPRIHYLYHGNRMVGMVSQVTYHAYSAYQTLPPGSTSAHKFLCVMFTLDEAKDFLQTIVGAQL